jgi:choline dehydrogenase-like flavoprotein
MNAMMVTRGRPVDYDAWREAGCEGWGYEDVMPYFLRMENNSRGDSEIHRAGGPVDVIDQVDPRPLTGRFIDAAVATGIPANPDINAPEQDGVTPTQVFQRNGRRWSAADAYLRPAMKRPNLTVKTKVHVVGLAFDGDRACGVRVRDSRGREALARADREVILAAGTIGSPQLLMLSGIGNGSDLREAGVEPRVELPGVGQNLQDHPFLTLCFESEVADDLADAEKPAALLKFLLRRRGPLTSNVGEAMAYIRTRSGLAAPDIELIFAPAYYHEHGFDEHEGHAFTVGPVLLSPRARGSIRLRSADPAAKPAIVGNHLSEPEDLAALVAGVHRSREIVASSPLSDVAGSELVPGPGVESDSEIEDFVRREVELLYHPAGTCRMGAADDDDAVVDPQLRVRGVENLRVVDASVMPLIPGGHIHLPVMMIGERAADLIKAG